MQFLDFLLVRKAQVKREIRAMGLLYSFFLLLFLLLAIGFYSKAQQLRESSLYALAIISLLITSVHYTRRDHGFINAVAENPVSVYLAEYFVLTLPLFIVSLFFGNLLILLSLPVILLCISCWKITAKKSNHLIFFQLLVKDPNFEWKSGLRKMGIVLAFLWILAIALVWVPFAPLVVLWFFLLTLSSFYEEGESREMLESYQMGAKVFVRNKIYNQVRIYLLTILPVITAAGIFFPERWWVLILFMVFGSLNLAVFVVSKYAVWQPGEINRSGSVLNSVCMLGLFLPFLLPLPVLVFFRNYRKAIHNLNPVLHDFGS